MVKSASAEAMDDVFSALAHPIRRAIIEQLAGDPATVSELAAPHDVSLPAVSRHLRVLEAAGLIEVEPDGRVRRCHLDPRPLQAAVGWLTRYRVLWEDRLDRLEGYLEADDGPDADEPPSHDDDHEE